MCQTPAGQNADGTETIPLPLLQGEDGSPGNGTAGCPGFQVCANICSCVMIHTDALKFVD